MSNVEYIKYYTIIEFVYVEPVWLVHVFTICMMKIYRMKRLDRLAYNVFFIYLMTACGGKKSVP